MPNHPNHFQVFRLTTIRGAPSFVQNHLGNAVQVPSKGWNPVPVGCSTREGPGATNFRTKALSFHTFIVRLLKSLDLVT